MRMLGPGRWGGRPPNPRLGINARTRHKRHFPASARAPRTKIAPRFCPAGFVAPGQHTGTPWRFAPSPWGPAHTRFAPGGERLPNAGRCGPLCEARGETARECACNSAPIQSYLLGQCLERSNRPYAYSSRPHDRCCFKWVNSMPSGNPPRSLRASR